MSGLGPHLGSSDVVSYPVSPQPPRSGFSILPQGLPTCSPCPGGPAQPAGNLSIAAKPTPSEGLGPAVFLTFLSPEPDGEEF